MAEASKLELLLLAKDKMSPAIQRLLKLLKEAGKSGKGIDDLAKKLDKTSAATDKAAKSQEKYNNARKRDSRGKFISDGTAKEVSEKNKLAAANEKAAKSEEKLNNARRRGRGGSRNQRGFEDDLLAGGAGAGGLWMSKQGLTAAMTKQEAMTDLYTSFYRANQPVSELNRQMAEGEKIAERLGNKLPGTTATFLRMFTIMKQRGIESKVVLEGAGEAAAYLAVANKEDTEDVGKNIARFGQVFNLKTRAEYMSAADLMSRANTTYSLKSQEMMEAVKDFSGRTGKGLGLDGIKGAEDTLRFLTFLRAKTGLEGLTVGSAASSFFSQYLQAKEKKKDPTEELKKLTGVDLKIFDDKGKFSGLENAVKEFSKLQGKLTDEQMVAFGNKLAGEEGASVFQAMVKNGGQWGEFNAEMTNSMSLMDKSSKNAENLTNKLEALTGSLQNLGSATFKPLIDPLSKATDKTNDFVGYLTKVAEGKPIFAGTTAAVLTLGAAFLTLKGGTGLASRFLGGASESILAVGNEATKSASKVGKLRSALTVGNAFKFLLVLETVGFTWEQIAGLRKTVDDWHKMNKGTDDVGQMGYKAYSQTPDNQKNPVKEAESVLSILQQGSKQLEKSLDPSRRGWLEWFGQLTGTLVGGKSLDSLYGPNSRKEEERKWQAMTPQQQEARMQQTRDLTALYKNQPLPAMFTSALERASKVLLGSETLQQRAPSLQDPSVMSAFRQTEIPKMNLSGEMKAHFEEMLKHAFPKSFEQSNQQMAQKSSELTQAFGSLSQPTTALGEQFSGLSNNSTTATSSVGNFANAANSAANRLNSVQFTPPIFSPIQVPVYTQTPNQIPLGGGRARGGSVTKGKTYPVGEIGTEWFTPSQSGSIISNDVLRNSRGGTASASNISFSVAINVDGAGSPKETALEIKREFTAIVSEFKEQMNPRNLARGVAFEAERDYERT